MGNKIQKQIVFNIAENRYFSILADVISEMTHPEQLSISLRFVKMILQEFLCFVPVSSTAGKYLTTFILSELPKLSLYLDLFRGQGYLGQAR